jgi:hypothetical protein
MMWMEFECQMSLTAKTPETLQHFLYFFGTEFSRDLLHRGTDNKFFSTHDQNVI